MNIVEMCVDIILNSSPVRILEGGLYRYNVVVNLYDKRMDVKWKTKTLRYIDERIQMEPLIVKRELFLKINEDDTIKDHLLNVLRTWEL